jgi:putative methanogenesis marker 16 metalloprotein
VPAQRSIAEINDRLARGEAVVMSAMEFKQQVRGGHRFKLGDVDVVTTATRAVMSGTSSFLGVPVGSGKTVRRIWLNGVPCMIAGQGDGQVDVAVHGTAESRDFPAGYGGGHLLRDLVSGESVDLEWESTDGRSFSQKVTLSDLPFARLYSYRNAYRNYSAFTNAKNRRSYRERPNTIFANRPLPWMRALTVSGSGELNPLENDLQARVIRSGTRVLVNKAEGVVIGAGTRSSTHGPNLSLAADLRGMDPEFMGGFRTRHGMEVTNGVAVPIPVVDEEILKSLSQCLDENIPMDIADLADRIPFTQATYADVWDGAALWVDFDPERCIVCSVQCPAETFCPMGAISWREKRIDQSLCVACGACTANCPGGAFAGRERTPQGRIGELSMAGRAMPITYRLSNRRRSLELAVYLKERLLERSFFLGDAGLPLKLATS